MSEKNLSDYFCENCFENKDIKQFIRNNGEEIKQEFNCSFCKYEVKIDDFDIDDCIGDYVSDCIANIEKKVSSLDYEKNEDKYYENCKNSCKEQYTQDCKDKLAETTYIIKKDILVKKMKKLVNKLYEHEDEHGFYSSASSEFWTEGVDDPCHIAGLEASNDICYDIFGFDEAEIQEIFEDIFGEFHECPWLSKCFDDRNKYKLENWNKFCEHTKHKARYFDHQDYSLSVTQILDDLDNFLKKIITSNKSDIYRARIINTDEEKKDVETSPSTELGKAPVKIVKNNRFSPIGISYGYFAFDQQTALAEIRVSKNDTVVIGKFKLEKSLKLIDFRLKSIEQYTNPFKKDFDMSFYCSSFMIKFFLKDISKPVNESDSVLEYIPTQIMAEYIWSKEYDGFIFDSSQQKGGENIVIFGDNPKYIEYQIIKIIEKNTNYKYEPITVENSYQGET